MIETSDRLASIAPRVLPVTRIKPQQGWAPLDLQAIWNYRELLYFLVWRDLKVRYKQTAIGAGWAIIQPLLTVLIFSVVFGAFAHLPTDGTPYFLNTYCGLLPWGLFAGAVNRSGTSLVTSSNLISKVYFPRILVPLSAVLGALADFAISFGMFLVLLAFHGGHLTPAVLLVPIWTLLVVLLGLAIGLILSALNVRYRDVSFLIGFLLQIWMYLSPVAYSTTLVPEKWRALYELNPMVGIIQGFRWSLIGTPSTIGLAWLPTVLWTALLLLGALTYFRRMERLFADII
jgi:lipopolysaccharide transport system permease protein